jgi:hypothetical protein
MPVRFCPGTLEFARFLPEPRVLTRGHRQTLAGPVSSQRVVSLSVSGETGRNHMTSFIGPSGARAVLAAILAAGVTAGLLMAVQPAAAQDPAFRHSFSGIGVDWSGNP